MRACMLIHTVHMIKSPSTAHIYIGQTQNVKKDLKDHNTGRLKLTRTDRLWILFAIEIAGSQNKAMTEAKKLSYKWLDVVK